MIGAVALYVIAAGVMYAAQRRFMYFPDPVRTAPAAAGLRNVSEIIIPTVDGEKLIAWYGKARPGQPTLLYLHGNGGSLALRAETMHKYLQHGRGMLMLAYRGFSGSTGSPTEAANVADAELAYDMLVRDGVKPEDIILYGESLGSGVAIQVAKKKKVEGVILDAPYTSILELASAQFPWLPVGWLLKDRYESIKYIGDVHAPIFILHGEADDIVPVEMGRRLFAAANPPKEIKTIPGGGHVIHDGPSFDFVNGWIDRLRAGKVRAPD
ncbi:MAG: alpha/beta hydrolase [Hyphomicrobium sp.]|uniref:alpha/beta hydrolase n=1 Tax=Hyphomicrobium sp. TaxID=82 RepID=UPI0039E397D4